jgi:hypothetical protein
MLFTFVKGIGYPSTFVTIQFRQSDPAHRRAANGHAIEAFFYFFVQIVKTCIFISLFQPLRVTQWR